MTSSVQEQFYADNLMENLNKDEMISLPISSVYRILNIYKEKNEVDIKEKNKIGSFLSKYFKVHGEDSILLFSIFNISNLDYNYFDLFLTYCSDSFDYVLIQKLLIKTIIDLTSAIKSQKKQINECNENNKLLTKRIIKINKKYSDQNALIQQNTQDQMRKNKKYEKEISDLKKIIQEQSDQIKILTNMITDVKRSNENKIENLESNLSSINELLSQNETDLKQQNYEINDVKNKQSNQKKQISKIQNNLKSIESKNNEDINDIQSSIILLNDKLKQFIKKYNDKTKFKYKIKNDFEYNGNNNFNGIINYLSKKCIGNVHLKKIVNVTASSILDSYFPQYIVDLNNCSNYFHSQNQQNSWIQYNFKDFRVRPTAYTIRTRHDWGKGNNHPKNWCIEGSNDRIN